MKQTLNAPMVPSVHVTVNKSRLKLYSKNVEIPTYYLQKGQEFQLEIFNPTTTDVLAKISLNNNLISQGGLIIKPGQRIFLERYIDVPNKFLFDTYEVSNTDEVKKAIETNGDIKIEFFREKQYIPPFWVTNGGNSVITIGQPYINLYNSDINNPYYLSSTPINTSNSSYFLSQEFSTNLANEVSVKKPIKSIETGRVEKGSHSSQQFKTINKSFELWAFHTIEYKLLPISQKINTVDDINVKVYCTNCGSKLGKTDRFCSQCGHKK